MKIVTQADFSDCLALQKKLVQAADKLSSMAGSVASAKQVREFEGDRRKRALAIATIPFLKSGDSHARAETEARATDGYRNEMVKLATELQVAEKAIMEYESTKIQWESARSLLAMAKSQMAIL